MPEPAHLDFARRTSPLQAFWRDMAAASVGGPSSVAVRELPFLAQVNLRGDAEDSAFLAAVRGGLGLDLPVVPNTVSSASAVSALWLGPDEWLLVGKPGSEENIATRLREVLAGLHSSIVDVSADRAIIELSGGRSRHLLTKGCSIDLHPRAFAPGRCAQTIFSRTGVILEQTADTPAWRLFVRSSFAPHLARWLLDAMTEYGLELAPAGEEPKTSSGRERGVT
jgi:sarcosine oxidase subunit gamma